MKTKTNIKINKINKIKSSIINKDTPIISKSYSKSCNISDNCSQNLIDKNKLIHEQQNSVSIQSYNYELYDLSKDIVRQTYIILSNYMGLNRKNNDLLNNENIDKILKNVLPNISKKYTVITKRRNRKLIPTSDMCMGRKIDGNQCTRRKINSTDYCKSHNRKCPNGRIDETHINSIKVKAKRGRKRKVEFDTRHSDPTYIPMWETIIDGDRKLIDKFENVYSYDLQHPVYLGKKSLENTLIKN